jgi:hypothetical protein
MASSLDLTSLLPNRYRDKTIDSIIKNLFNRFLSKPDTVPLFGYVGDQANLLSGEVQIIESDLERQINQLTPFIFSEHASEKLIFSWYDLQQKFVTLGIDHYALQEWFSTKSYNLVPPIDLDKFCNFQDYFWIGDWILKNPTVDYSAIGIAQLAPSSTNSLRTYQEAFSSWGNASMTSEYYVISRGVLGSGNLLISPLSTFPTGLWSDWSYSNLWIHRDDLNKFIQDNGVIFSLADVVQATRPIIEYPCYLGLNTAQINGAPIDSGARNMPLKAFKNQLPLFDLYHYDGSHAGVTSAIFYYVEDQSYAIDAVVGRRFATDVSGDFIFEHALVNSDDQSLYFYKLYDQDGINFTSKTIWRQPDSNNKQILQYSKYDTSGTIINTDMFVNYANYYWTGADYSINPVYNITGLPEYYVISKGGTSDWSTYNYWVHVSKIPRNEISTYIQATKPIIEFNLNLESQLISNKTEIGQQPRFAHYFYDQDLSVYSSLPITIPDDININDAYLNSRLFARISDLPPEIQTSILSNPEILANNCFQYEGVEYIQGLYNGAYYQKDNSGTVYGYKSRVTYYNGTGDGTLNITNTSTLSYPELITFTYNGIGFDVNGTVTGPHIPLTIGSSYVIDGCTLHITVGNTPFITGDKFTLEISSFVFYPRNLYVLISGVYRTLSSASLIINEVQKQTVISTDPANHDGIWSPPPQLEWNVLNDTKTQINEGDLYYHFTSIIGAQPGLLGSGTGTNNWRLLSQDVGLGGIIKQFDGDTALLISTMLQQGLSTNALIDFAKFSYESLSTSITQFVQNIIPDMLVKGVFNPPEITTTGNFVIGKTYTIASVGTTDFTVIGASSNVIGVTFIASWMPITANDPSTGTGTAIDDTIDQSVIDAFKTFFAAQNPVVMASPSVVDDTVSAPFYDTTSSLFNLIVTLPYIGLGTLVSPEKKIDTAIISTDFPSGMPMLVHHDGHETQLLNPSSVIDYAKKIVQKSYVRSPGQETPGIISGFNYPERPYAGQFWFKTSTGELYIFNAICDNAIALSNGNEIPSVDLVITDSITGLPRYTINQPLGSKYGSFAFNRATNDIFQTNGVDEWAYLGNNSIDAALPWMQVRLDLITNNLELAIETELYNKCPTLTSRLNLPDFQANFTFAQTKVDSTWQSQYNYQMTKAFQNFGVAYGVVDVYSSPTIYTFWTKTLDFLYSQQKTYFKIDPLTYVRETWGVLHKQIDEYTLSPQIGRKESPADFTLHNTALLDIAQDSWVNASLVSFSAGSFIIGNTYIIKTIGTTDFTSIGAFANEVGQYFIATGVGTGTGTATVTPPNWTYTYTFTCVSRQDGIFKLVVSDFDAAVDLSNAHPPTEEHPLFYTLNASAPGTTIINSLSYVDKYVSIALSPSRRGFFWGDSFTINVDSSGNCITTISPQTNFKAEGFNQIFVQYGRIYGEDTQISVNNTLLSDWVVKMGYRFGGMINTDTLTIESQNTAIIDSAFNVYLKENDLYNSAWINALRVQLAQRGSTTFTNGVNVPAIGPNGTPGEDWIFRIDNYNKNRTSLTWYDYDITGDFNTFVALDGTVTNFPWKRFKTTTTPQTQNAPFLVTGIQNLITFIEGYSDKLLADGWVFSDPTDQLPSDAGTASKAGYQLLIEQFIVQQFSGVVAGSAFIFNPFQRKVWYRTPHGVVSNVHNVLGLENETVCAILDQNNKQISNGDIRVFRQDDLTELVFDTPVYTLHLLTSDYEHVVLFENYSANSMLLYDPFLGQKTTWIFLEGQKQANFTGKIDFGGHFILGETMKKNIENSINQIIGLYDTSAVDVDAKSLDMARSLLGYQKKPYFSIRNSTDTTQFRFWQGMIANKGTNFSVDAFINSTSYENAKLQEYWAYKIAEYGDSRMIINTEMRVQPDDCTGEYTNYVFLEADDIATSATNTPRTSSTDISNFYDEVLYDYGGYSHSSSTIVYNPGTTQILPADETRWYSYSDLNQLTYLEATVIAQMDLPPVDSIVIGDCFVIYDSLGKPVRADCFEIVNANSTSASTQVFREQGDYVVGSNPVQYTYPRFTRVNQSTIKILDLGGDSINAGSLIIGLEYKISSLGSTDWSFCGATNPTIGAVFIATNRGEQPAGTFVIGGTYTIISIGTTDFTLIGATSNSITESFVATGVGSGTGTAAGTGVVNTIPVTGTLKVLAYGPAANEYSPNLLYDYVNNILVRNDIIWWDPARGIHYPQAAASISYDDATDPAIYTDSISQYKNITTGKLKPWGSNQVGKVWWNTQNLYWQPYSDEKEFSGVLDRLARWGALSDASSINVYEWVKSIIPPSEAALGSSVNGEPAISNYVQRNRTWWQRPTAWRYSSNPALIPPAFLAYQPQRLQITTPIQPDGTGVAVLKGDANPPYSFDDLNLIKGTKITGVNYSGDAKLDDLIIQIFGLAEITSTYSKVVVGSASGYADGPIITSSYFNNFQVILNENVLKFRDSYLGQYVVSTYSNIASLDNDSIVHGSAYVDGSYYGIPLTGGSGFGATADITVSGGGVTGVNLISGGSNYAVGDVLHATIPGGGTGFAITVSTVNTAINLMHVLSGANQQLTVIDVSGVAGQQLTYNFDTLGVELTIQFISNLSLTSAAIAADLITSVIYLRSSVDVKVPIVFNDGVSTYTEFFSVADSTATLGWVAWNDPSSNPNLGSAPPLNQYSPISGNWTQVGAYLHDVSDDIVNRMSDQWTWFDGLDYTPYKSSWTQWAVMKPIFSEARYLLKTTDTYSTFCTDLSTSLIGLSQQVILSRAKVYLNERLLLNSQWVLTTVGSNYVVNITESLLKTGDVARVIVSAYIPTPTDLTFDPTVSDLNPFLQVQYKLDYPFVKESLRDSNDNLTIFNYYYWVKNKTTPGNPNQLSTKSITNLLTANDSLYAIPQSIKYYNQLDGRPNRYSMLSVKDLGLEVRAVDRYKLRLNKNPTMRDNDKNISLKPVFTEWMLLRDGQLDLIPTELWTKLTDTLTGSTMLNQSLPFAPLALYDQKNGTSVGVGVDDGQIMTKSKYAIDTVKHTILNTKVDKYENGVLVPDYISYSPSPASSMYGASGKFDITQLDTYLSSTINIRQFMSDLWRFAKPTQVNEIFFAVLQDMAASDLEIDAFFKTSFISLNDVRTSV